MICKEYMVPMRDGTLLHTRCMLPHENGRFPIIFSRSPYDDPACSPDERTHAFEENAACAGFAVVHQSCRGTALSEGCFVPFYSERSDGLDTLSWLRRQSFYDGEIYVHGESYMSYVHLSYLGTHQSDIKGAFLFVMPTDMYAGMSVNGIFKQDVLTPWFIQQYHNKQLDMRAVYSHYPELTFTRPHYAALDSYYEGGCPEYAAYLRGKSAWHNPNHGPGEALDAMRNLDIPILLMEGWYDIYIGSGSHMWEELPAAVRQQSAMLVGPWQHSCRLDPDCPIALPGGERPDDLLLNWFCHLHAGEELRCVRKGQVKYYTIGEGQWHFAPHMPCGTKSQTFYLCAESRLKAEAETPLERSYRYDPADPTPFTGGANAFSTVPRGIVPDPPPNSRADILSFISEPLKEDMTLSGCVSFRLHVKSDCEDTAFFARLTVLKDGHYLPVQESITTLRRENPDYAPSSKACVTMTCDPACWRFHRGDRLRIDVSSACWPIYEAHGNVPGDTALQKEERIAFNTLFTGLSSVTLPIE